MYYGTAWRQYDNRCCNQRLRGAYSKKRFVSPGSLPRTSIASKYPPEKLSQKLSRSVLAPTFIRPFAKTRLLGRVIARWISLGIFSNALCRVTLSLSRFTRRHWEESTLCPHEVTRLMSLRLTSYNVIRLTSCLFGSFYAQAAPERYRCTSTPVGPPQTLSTIASVDCNRTCTHRSVHHFRSGARTVVLFSVLLYFILGTMTNTQRLLL